MKVSRIRQGLAGGAALASCLAFSACSSSSVPNGQPVYAGQLYAQTNATTGNAIVRYGRGADGRLTYLDTTATGGNGIGGANITNGANSVDPLFSSYSVVLTSDHSRLFTVNAGSNTVSSFSVSGTGAVQLIGTYPTGGTLPTSIAVSGNLLYVSHAKANAANVQITGFTISASGVLQPITGAQYPASGTTTAGEVLFSPDGSLLEFSELQTKTIALYPVHPDGTLGTPVRNASVGAAPFGGAFLDQHHLIVAEAGAGAVSSYLVASTGSLTPISSSVTNGQKATCWVRITPNGRYVYAANTTSGDVSVYSIDAISNLSLINPNQAFVAAQGFVDVGGNPSSGPVDGVVSSDSKYYYQEYSGAGRIGAYAINADGTLTAIANGDATNLPSLGAEGVAGY